MGHIFVGEKHKYAKLLNFMKNQRKELNMEKEQNELNFFTKINTKRVLIRHRIDYIYLTEYLNLIRTFFRCLYSLFFPLVPNGYSYSSKVQLSLLLFTNNITITIYYKK